MVCWPATFRRAHGPGGHLRGQPGGQLGNHLGVDGSTGSHLEVIVSSGGHLASHLGAWAVGLSLPEGSKAMEVISSQPGVHLQGHLKVVGSTGSHLEVILSSGITLGQGSLASRFPKGPRHQIWECINIILGCIKVKYTYIYTYIYVYVCIYTVVYAI